MECLNGNIHLKTVIVLIDSGNCHQIFNERSDIFKN